MLQNEGIQLQTNVPYTPKQNGFSGSSINRIYTVARAPRMHFGLPEELWPELVHIAVYQLNRTPTKGFNWDKPFERYYGKKLNISNLKIIGCRAFVKIPPKKAASFEKICRTRLDMISNWILSQ